MVTNGSNGFDPFVVRGYATRIEALYSDMDGIKGAAAAECKKVRADIAEVFEEAKIQGIPLRPFRTELKARRLELKADAVRDALDEDDMASCESIAMALGDFAGSPLGQAAVSKGKKGKGRKPAAADSDTLDDLTA